jgi:hypothetical protein
MDLRIPTIQLNNVVFDQHYLKLMRALDPSFAGSSSLAWPPSLTNLSLNSENVSLLRALGVTYLILPGHDTADTVPDSHPLRYFNIQGIDYTLFSFAKHSSVVFGPSHVTVASAHPSAKQLRQQLLDYPAVFTSGDLSTRAASGAGGLSLIHETITTSGFKLIIHAKSSGLAVIRFLPLSGEVLKVNNAHAEPPMRVDQVFTGITIPNGTSTITANFVTRQDTEAVAVSLIAIAAIAIGLFLGYRLVKRDQRKAPLSWTEEAPWEEDASGTNGTASDVNPDERGRLN